MSAPTTFLLDVETDHPARRATLRLSLHEGPFLAAPEVALDRRCSKVASKSSITEQVRAAVTLPAT